MSDRLMDVDDVANYLGMPKSRVYNNWRAWKLPFFKVGQQLRCRRWDLEKWVARKAVS
ncbi:helix-turn-helix domain-containing protein [Microbispora hainanensis]|uniref:helix-turn-helix domain-containing protein n=1 Tax=Microbispora hainanensis TaxID=568844 RepID=UPI0033DEBB84